MAFEAPKVASGMPQTRPDPSGEHSKPVERHWPCPAQPYTGVDRSDDRGRLQPTNC